MVPFPLYEYLILTSEIILSSAGGTFKEFLNRLLKTVSNTPDICLCNNIVRSPRSSEKKGLSLIQLENKWRGCRLVLCHAFRKGAFFYIKSTILDCRILLDFYFSLSFFGASLQLRQVSRRQFRCPKQFGLGCQTDKYKAWKISS